MHWNTTIGTDLNRAASFLNKGEVIGIPTETVYGLAANAFNEEAVLKIFKVKNRPTFNPLIVHTSHLDRIHDLVQEIPDEARIIANQFWPGPLTLLLKKKPSVSDLVTAGSPFVALRIPNHPLTLSLLNELDFPLAAPSATPSGYVSPTSAIHVFEQLKGKIPFILDGGSCPVGLESTILGWNDQNEPILYRHGGLSVEQIEAVLNRPIRQLTAVSEDPDTPGQLKSHYATTTPLYIGEVEQIMNQTQCKKPVLIRFQTYYPGLPETQQFILSSNGSTDEAARHLFQLMRKADQSDADIVIAEPAPNTGLGIAINDRLRRAQYVMKL
jgi:L-threonylcarbamoyladenylate synthase